MTLKILGKPKTGKEEELDEADTRKEAEKLAREYRNLQGREFESNFYWVIRNPRSIIDPSIGHRVSALTGPGQWLAFSLTNSLVHENLYSRHETTRNHPVQ